MLGELFENPVYADMKNAFISRVVRSYGCNNVVSTWMDCIIFTHDKCRQHDDMMT